MNGRFCLRMIGFLSPRDPGEMTGINQELVWIGVEIPSHLFMFSFVRTHYSVSEQCYKSRPHLVFGITGKGESLKMLLTSYPFPHPIFLSLLSLLVFLLKLLFFFYFTFFFAQGWSIFLYSPSPISLSSVAKNRVFFGELVSFSFLEWMGVRGGCDLFHFS
jgi:hypothetical protein